MGRRNPYSSGRRTFEILREIGAEAGEAAKNALREGAEIIVADAKSRCPVKTGKLRESIKAERNSDGTAYKISANAHRTDRNGRKYYYGRRMEFDPEINKPFLYPALDAHKDEIREMVIESARNAIRRGV